MRKTTLVAIVFLFLCLLLPALSFAAWVWSPEAGKFVSTEAEVQGTPQEQYEYAMGFYKEKDLKEAAQQLRLLLKKFPTSQIAPESLYRLGVIYEEMGDYYKAFRAYRDLLQRYPQTERMSEAIEKEFRIANLFLSGKRAKVMGLGILPSGPRAIEVFKHIVETAPYSEFGDRAQFHLGIAYKKSNQFETAIQAFQTLIDQYPQSKLVPQARYQIADTSYLESVVATRDQKVIDRAAKEIDQFLKRYPDTGISDKAAKLRQEIDEKNAEKNYRIGLFYEKENFLESAFIYYRDVTARYAHTQWGGRAKERLLALEKPAEYLKSQEAQILSEKQQILDKLGAAADETQRKDLEWELKRIEKEEKELQKSKPATLKRRRAALRQKERELKEKQKNLAKKKKRFAKNPSEDLVLAFQRWEASLEKEKADLVREKLRIEDWETNLGVSTEPFYAQWTQWIPFGKAAPSPVEQVRQVEAERLAKLAKEKVELLKEKETLYREYDKFTIHEGATVRTGARLERDREKLERQADEIERLQEKLGEKEALYGKYFGTSPWQAMWRVPTKVVARSVGILNPFEGANQKDWDSKSLAELKTLESHWQEKLSSQKTLVETISRAFDDELARAEEKRLFANVEEKETDPHALRRAVKQLEREVRSRYNEIQDRNNRKNELLEKLEDILHAKGDDKSGLARGGSILAAPVTGTVKFWRAFLFGLPDRDVELTKEAKRRVSDGEEGEAIRSLRKEIELESLLIQARNEEIQKLSRELEALRARASLSQAPAFRSLLIKFPYVFVREAITSAGRLVPKEGRQEKLIEQLNEETQKLEPLKQELARIQKSVKEKSGKETQGVESPLSAVEAAAPPAELQVSEVPPSQSVLRDEIQSLQKQLEFLGQSYEHDLDRFEKLRWNEVAEVRGNVRTEKASELEEELIQLIEREQKIHQEESGILAKKKELAEQFLRELPADLFAEELNLEKKEIESRLNEIQKRQMTLGEELKRFRSPSLPPS